MPRVKKVRLNLRVHPTLLKEIKEMAKKKELTVTSFVEITLRTVIRKVKEQDLAREHKDAESI